MGRSLGLCLLVLGLLMFYENRRSWRAVPVGGVGAALLTMLRVDGPLIAAAGILCFIVWVLRETAGTFFAAPPC